MLAHVAGCEICRAELATLRETASQLAFAAPSPVATGSRERIHSRLMDRVAADARARGVSSAPTARVVAEFAASGPTPGRGGGWRRAEWLAVAASVLFFIAGALFVNATRDRQNLRDALQAELARGQSARTSSDSLRTVVALRDSMIAGLIGRDVAVMSLTASGAKAPFARMFWDTARNTWTLVAHNMPALKTGRTYQLWLVTTNAKISAGTFEPTNGDAVVRATYPLAPRFASGNRDHRRARGWSSATDGRDDCRGRGEKRESVVLIRGTPDTGPAWDAGPVSLPDQYDARA